MNLVKSVSRAQDRGRFTRSVLLAGFACLSATTVLAASPNPAAETPYDLTPVGNTKHNVPGEVGGTAIFSDYFLQPAGTGVFKPFLDLKSPANGKIEHAFNSDEKVLDFNGHRAPWNRSLRFGELADIMIDGTKYYGFVLDANEPGPAGTKSLISIDNVRVYTSQTYTADKVLNNIDNLDNLGTLRWALNDPVRNTTGDNQGYNIDPWVKLDAAQDNLGKPSNGGSGIADMVLYIPAADFGNAGPDDYVWLYNLNGVHYEADTNLGATSGFEEWRAITGPHQVPDGGATAALLGIGLLGLGAMRRKS